MENIVKAFVKVKWCNCLISVFVIIKSVCQGISSRYVNINKSQKFRIFRAKMQTPYEEFASGQFSHEMKPSCAKGTDKRNIAVVCLSPIITFPGVQFMAAVFLQSTHFPFNFHSTNMHFTLKRQPPHYLDQ